MYFFRQRLIKKGTAIYIYIDTQRTERIDVHVYTKPTKKLNKN